MPVLTQRYHLTVELQKMGSQPDKTLLDRLVKQHYPLVQKQRESATAEPPSIEQGAASAAEATSVLTPPASVGDAFSPAERWSADAEGDDDLPSNLLNLDFTEDVDQQMDSALYVPPFIDPIAPQETPGFDTASAFVQDKEASAPPGETSIDPQLVLSQPEPVAPDAPLFPSLTLPEPNVPMKSESPAPMPMVAEEPESDTTFTAFTPMRLDQPTPSRPKLDMRATSPDVENLRPSMEEYNKLSSKEKRQLRNKISARNFRNRRKEYITLLEDQIQERDRIIESLKDQLSSLRIQNSDLTNEVRSYQTRAPSVDMSKLLGALQRSSDEATRSPRLSAQNGLVVPNMRKDVSPSPRSSSPTSSFWGGVPSLAQSAPAMVA